MNIVEKITVDTAAVQAIFGGSQGSCLMVVLNEREPRLFKQVARRFPTILNENDIPEGVFEIMEKFYA